MTPYSYNPAVSVAFSGHRVVPVSQRRQVQMLLKDEIVKAYRQGYRLFYCGMAMGFDLLAAEAALSLQTQLNELKVIAVVPHPDQTKLWQEIHKVMYEKIIGMVDSKIVLSERYYSGCLLRRNDYLVEHTSLLIALFNGNKKGGTFYTHRKAMERGLRVVNLYESLNASI